MDNQNISVACWSQRRQQEAHEEIQYTEHDIILTRK